MNKSDSIASLASALSSAQSEIGAVAMNSTNPFLKNKYADLGAVIEAARATLAKYALSVTQWPVSDGDKIGVETVVSHSSGEWMSSTVYLEIGEEKGKSRAQVAGSVITYLRRYAYAAALGMYAEEDTDGSGSHQNQVKKPQEQASLREKSMTLDEALNTTSSDGTKYCERDTEQLAHIFNNPKAPAEKREAARLIIESRKENK